MTDHKLLHLLRTDPNAGMTQLIKQYSGLVFSIVKGITSEVCDSSEVEDCVTDVFLNFQHGLDSFKPDASIKTYLGVIARNTALKCVRNRITYTSIDDEDIFVEIPDDSDVSEEIAEKLLLERVFNEIANLGHPDSDIMFGKYYLGLSTKAIAEKLKLSVSNVDTRAHRALQKLRDKFGGDNS